MRSNPSALGSITILRKHERQAARPPSSFLSPLATIFSELSESGLCSLSASSAGAFMRSVDRVVAKQGAIGRENVHKPAVRLVLGNKRHPNLSVDRLNAVGREILRNLII